VSTARRSRPSWCRGLPSVTRVLRRPGRFSRHSTLPDVGPLPAATPRAGPGTRLRRALRRRRRLLAAALVAAAAAVAVDALAPPEPPSRTATVAARDLAAGTVLASSDLTSRRLPPDAVADGALTAAAAVQRVLTTPVRRGEVLTDARVWGPGLLAGQPAGVVGVPVRPSDPAATALLRPGMSVDVLGSPADGGMGLDPLARGQPATTLAAGATVLAVAGGPAPGGLLTGADAADGGAGPLVLLAVDAWSASRLAGAAAHEWVSVVIVP
jgi:pilus assembly protein CpaB